MMFAECFQYLIISRNKTLPAEHITFTETDNGTGRRSAAHRETLTDTGKKAVSLLYGKEELLLKPAVNKYDNGSLFALKGLYDKFVEEQSKPDVHLYKLTSDLKLYGDDGKVVETVEKGGIYTGVPDPENSESIMIDYEYSTLTVDSEIVDINENAVVLPTAAIGQMGGDIYGITACGPTAMTILVNWEKQTNTTKDELIKYSKKHDLEDQGAIDEPHGGMTAPKLIELANGYYEGDIVSANIYSDDPLSTIDEKIDSGHRSLVAVRYTKGEIVADTEPSGVHFVIICGYEDTAKGRVYYYADPYYGDGGHSLLKVSSKTLAKSMKQVKSEPRTLIVLE